MRPKYMPRIRLYYVRGDERELLGTLFGDGIQSLGNQLSYCFRRHFCDEWNLGAIETVRDMWEVGTR